MSNSESSAQSTQSRDEPTVTATTANSDAVNHFARGVRLAAGAVFVILVIAVVFFAGFFTGRHYGDRWSDNYFAVPAEGNCIKTICQPAGPKWGTHCYQVVVPCP